MVQAVALDWGGSSEGGEERYSRHIEPATLAGEVIVGVQTPLGLGIGKLPGWWWQVCMGETRRGRGRACGRWKSKSPVGPG